jgi:hypothetical protein
MNEDTDMNADDLMNIFLNEGHDAFTDAFTEWYTDENQDVYDLVIRLGEMAQMVNLVKNG